MPIAAAAFFRTAHSESRNCKARPTASSGSCKNYQAAAFPLDSPALDMLIATAAVFWMAHGGSCNCKAAYLFNSLAATQNCSEIAHLTSGSDHLTSGSDLQKKQFQHPSVRC